MYNASLSIIVFIFIHCCGKIKIIIVVEFLWALRTLFNKRSTYQDDCCTKIIVLVVVVIVVVFFFIARLEALNYEVNVIYL